MPAPRDTKGSGVLDNSLIQVGMAWLPHPAQLIGIAGLLMSIAATIHVLLKKENELSAIAWLGIVWLVPFLGCFLYWSFGINRVRRRARLLRQGRKDGDQNPSEANNSFRKI